MVIIMCFMGFNTAGYVKSRITLVKADVHGATTDVPFIFWHIYLSKCALRCQILDFLCD